MCSGHPMHVSVIELVTRVMPALAGVPACLPCGARCCNALLHWTPGKSLLRCPNRVQRWLLVKISSQWQSSKGGLNGRAQKEEVGSCGREDPGLLSLAVAGQMT